MDNQYISLSLDGTMEQETLAPLPPLSVIWDIQSRHESLSQFEEDLKSKIEVFGYEKRLSELETKELFVNAKLQVNKILIDRSKLDQEQSLFADVVTRFEESMKFQLASIEDESKKQRLILQIKEMASKIEVQNLYQSQQNDIDKQLAIIQQQKEHISLVKLQEENRLSEERQKISIQQSDLKYQLTELKNKQSLAATRLEMRENSLHTDEKSFNGSLKDRDKVLADMQQSLWDTRRFVFNAVNDFMQRASGSAISVRNGKKFDSDELQFALGRMASMVHKSIMRGEDILDESERNLRSMSSSNNAMKRTY